MIFRIRVAADIGNRQAIFSVYSVHRISGPERTVPSGPPSPSDQGEKNILAENCHLAKICVYNIVPIKNFGTANNKDRCSLSKEDKELLQMHLLPPYEMGTHLT